MLVRKKSRHFWAPVASTVSTPSILTSCYFRHHRRLLNIIFERSTEPYFSTINSRIQEVHLFCDACTFIVHPFLPFPHQSCPVEWLTVSRWYPQQNIIGKNERSSEEGIDKKRQLSWPLQTRIPSTWEFLELILLYVNIIRLQQADQGEEEGFLGGPVVYS